MKEEKKKREHYVNNLEFYKAIVQYKKDCWWARRKKEPKPQLSNYIGVCLLLIAKNLANKSFWREYPFKEEMIGDGIENSIMYFDNFNPKKYRNPFAYFTQIMYYAFTRRIQKEKRQLYTRYKYFEQMGILNEHADESKQSKQFEIYENISEFISKYEERKAANLKEAKPKAKKTKPLKKPVRK